MVVCKFFQQGNCRFGQSCRFEHIYGSKYSYNAATSNQTPTSVTDEQLVNQVTTDIQAALNGGQWILSCYAPYKEKGLFPGLVEMSPNEARLMIYEAKANNTLDQAVAYFNNLVTEARKKHEQLLHPNSSIVGILRSIYKGEKVASPFNGAVNPGFGNASSAPSSIFRSAAQNVFGGSNTSSVFGQQTSLSQTSTPKSIFAQANQTVFPATQTSVFGTPSPVQPNQNVFATIPTQPANVFNQTSDPAKSIFAQASQNVFATSPPSVFADATKNTFETNNLSQQPANVFQIVNTQTSSGPFGNPSQNAFTEQIAENDVYSTIDEISPADLEAFNSDVFQMGLVPEIPPPKSLCI